MRQRNFHVLLQVCWNHGFGRANRQHWDCTYQKCCEARKDSAIAYRGWWVLLTCGSSRYITFLCLGFHYFVTWKKNTIKIRMRHWAVCLHHMTFCMISSAFIYHEPPRTTWLIVKRLNKVHVCSFSEQLVYMIHQWNTFHYLVGNMWTPNLCNDNRALEIGRSETGTVPTGTVPSTVFMQ